MTTWTQDHLASIEIDLHAHARELRALGDQVADIRAQQRDPGPDVVVLPTERHCACCDGACTRQAV